MGFLMTIGVRALLLIPPVIICGHVYWASRFDVNRAHLSESVLFLPQNTQYLISLESPLIPKFSKNVIPLHTDDPVIPDSYLSTRWGNCPGCYPIRLVPPGTLQTKWC